MPSNTEGGRSRNMGISSRRRFLTMLLTAGAAAMLASMIPNAITNNGQGIESTTANNSAISSVINEPRANQLITNGSTVNITVPTVSHISAIKTFPTNKTQQVNVDAVAVSNATNNTGSTSNVTNVSLTPLDDWYIVQIGPTPQVNIGNYMLVVDGLVNNPLNLTYSELTSMPTTTIIDTLQCVSDPYFLKAMVKWIGVPLKYVLNAAGVQSGATKVILYGADGYTSDLPLWKAMEDDTLIAFMADGQPLLATHGYPVRLVVPRWWGYKYVKWLVKITVTNENYLGYWESRGYPDVARKNGD
ncbi:oxidoreductase molybdopterin binding protein [Vulcanisaeta moutnovskia 768-28]|uniref:Oxidoreductase molybdopterin binding protein n=1 Tax=Vulcanisaeta moutnovskia (strain 768-28) TaxID=985053 RepID=F0QTQ7_VULM7|nr:molybdopterin-dependent oxidoreductase [Vulcanisaeta moutnovskia]ADY00523.1 oxidoreductase molybdopterin binding protein [Vulcanisaeta moutnovskia 768-28]